MNKTLTTQPKKIILTAIAWAIITLAMGQDAKELYVQGLEKAKAGEYEEALKLFDKSIALKADEYVAWYNRGVTKSILNRYEEALEDFEQSLKLNPDYTKGYLNSGTARKHLTDYDGALADYSHAIQLDPTYADAYYNRGLIYDMLGKKDSACNDFAKANQLGMRNAQRMIEKCNKTTPDIIPTHPILRLTKTADNRKYGFTENNPVKVGTGTEGGPANERAYLSLLRDAQGKAIKYERIASCCSYKSEYGFMGMAMLDKYEITYFDEKGKVVKETVYLSFYDYEEPLILYGFKTVKPK
jgi:tetratricopeptide (TPR) repeat protein